MSSSNIAIFEEVEATLVSHWKGATLIRAGGYSVSHTG
jgi:hypothetical protein